MPRPTYDHRSSQKPVPTSNTLPTNLADLYWLVHVVQAGSFAAAAQRTGMAKSNLSRRIIQLEKRMEVQLLIRKPGALHLTPPGSRIYRYALEMLRAAEAVERIAEQANGIPRGPLHLAAPGILAPWLYHSLSMFKAEHPEVDLRVTEADALTDLASHQLDASLSFRDVPSDSTDVVSRPLAELQMAIVGTPQLIEKLGDPVRLVTVQDLDLLASMSPCGLRSWVMSESKRSPLRPALYANDYQAVLNGARAGLGLACLPLHGCIADLKAGNLKLACPAERPLPSRLYALMNPHRGITAAARALVKHLRLSLIGEVAEGITALDDDIAAYQ